MPQIWWERVAGVVGSANDAIAAAHHGRLYERGLETVADCHHIYCIGVVANPATRGMEDEGRAVIVIDADCKVACEPHVAHDV